MSTHCSSLFLSALHNCDGQAETGDQGHGWGKENKIKKVKQNQTNSLNCFKWLFSIGPDPARPEGIDGNHEQNEQHASRLRG